MKDLVAKSPAILAVVLFVASVVLLAPSFIGGEENNLTIGEEGKTVEGGTFDNIIVSESVKDGNVFLKNVKILGNLIVHGGGSHSITLEGCTIDGAVEVDKKDGESPRIFASNTEIPSIVANSSTIIETEGTGSVGTVAVNNTEITVQGDSTVVSDIQSNGNSSLVVSDTATVTAVTQSAGSLSVEGTGNIEKVTAQGAEITVKGDSTTVKEIAASGESSLKVSDAATVSAVAQTGGSLAVEGTGTIAAITAEDSAISIKGESTKVESMSVSGNTSLSMSDNATVEFVNQTSGSLFVEGTGTVTNVTIKGSIEADSSTVTSIQVDDVSDDSTISIKGTEKVNVVLNTEKAVNISSETDNVDVGALEGITATATVNEEEVHIHNLVMHTEREPTCALVGILYYECHECPDGGSYVSEKGLIPKLPHTPVTDKAVAATCTDEGRTEGSHCSECGTIFVKQQTIKALGHDFVHHEAKAATADSVGWNAYDTCSRCDYSTYVEIPKLIESSCTCAFHELLETNKEFYFQGISTDGTDSKTLIQKIPLDEMSKDHILQGILKEEKWWTEYKAEHDIPDFEVTSSEADIDTVFGVIKCEVVSLKGMHYNNVLSSVVADGTDGEYIVEDFQYLDYRYWFHDGMMVKFEGTLLTDESEVKTVATILAEKPADSGTGDDSGEEGIILYFIGDYLVYANMPNFPRIISVQVDDGPVYVGSAMANILKSPMHINQTLTWGVCSEWSMADEPDGIYYCTIYLNEDGTYGYRQDTGYIAEQKYDTLEEAMMNYGFLTIEVAKFAFAEFGDAKETTAVYAYGGESFTVNVLIFDSPGEGDSGNDCDCGIHDLIANNGVIYYQFEYSGVKSPVYDMPVNECDRDTLVKSMLSQDNPVWQDYRKTHNIPPATVTYGENYIETEYGTIKCDVVILNGMAPARIGDTVTEVQEFYGYELYFHDGVLVGEHGVIVLITEDRKVEQWGRILAEKPADPSTTHPELVPGYAMIFEYQGIEISNIVLSREGDSVDALFLGERMTLSIEEFLSDISFILPKGAQWDKVYDCVLEKDATATFAGKEMHIGDRITRVLWGGPDTYYYEVVAELGYGILEFYGSKERCNEYYTSFYMPLDFELVGYTILEERTESLTVPGLGTYDADVYKLEGDSGAFEGVAVYYVVNGSICKVVRINNDGTSDEWYHVVLTSAGSSESDKDSGDVGSSDNVLDDLIAMNSEFVYKINLYGSELTTFNFIPEEMNEEVLLEGLDPSDSAWQQYKKDNDIPDMSINRTTGKLDTIYGILECQILEINGYTWSTKSDGGSDYFSPDYRENYRCYFYRGMLVADIGTYYPNSQEEGYAWVGAIIGLAGKDNPGDNGDSDDDAEYVNTYLLGDYVVYQDGCNRLISIQLDDGEVYTGVDMASVLNAPLSFKSTMKVGVLETDGHIYYITWTYEDGIYRYCDTDGDKRESAGSIEEVLYKMDMFLAEELLEIPGSKLTKGTYTYNGKTVETTIVQIPKSFYEDDEGGKDGSSESIIDDPAYVVTSYAVGVTPFAHYIYETDEFGNLLFSNYGCITSLTCMGKTYEGGALIEFLREFVPTLENMDGLSYCWYEHQVGDEDWTELPEFKFTISGGMIYKDKDGPYDLDTFINEIWDHGIHEITQGAKETDSGIYTSEVSLKFDKIWNEVEGFNIVTKTVYVIDPSIFGDEDSDDDGDPSSK